MLGSEFPAGRLLCPAGADLPGTMSAPIDSVCSAVRGSRTESDPEQPRAWALALPLLSLGGLLPPLPPSAVDYNSI